MKRLIEFPLENGSSIMVEVDEPEPRSGTVRGMRPSEVAEKAKQTFEAALERLKPTTLAIIAQLRDLGDPPQEATVEFGFNLSAEAGAVIASVVTQANFKVTLTWKHEEQRDR